jgi:hypothetical protein
MFIRAYLPQIFTALFGGLFVLLGILTFGNGWAFDNIHIGMLIFTGIICRKDINVVSVVILLLLQLIWESLAWQYLINENFVKIILYMCAFGMMYYLRHDWVVKIILPTLILVIVSEIYWYLTHYSAPEIYWHIWIMVSNLLVRYLIFIRVGIVDNYFPEKGLSVNLDWVIYKLSVFIIIIQATMILEYLLRHITGLSSMLFVYYSYSYLVHGIATIAVWAIFSESFKQLLPRLLKA